MWIRSILYNIIIWYHQTNQMPEHCLNIFVLLWLCCAVTPSWTQSFFQKMWVRFLKVSMYATVLLILRPLSTTKCIAGVPWRYSDVAYYRYPRGSNSLLHFFHSEFWKYNKSFSYFFFNALTSYLSAASKSSPANFCESLTPLVWIKCSRYTYLHYNAKTHFMITQAGIFVIAKSEILKKSANKCIETTFISFT